MIDATAAADAGLDATTREQLLRRIGLGAAPAADEDGLRVVHRAFVSQVPYEDLAVQLGEYRPLELDGLVRRMLSGGRGGYCFEANTVLRALLQGLGFSVERREGIVDSRDARSRGELTNHMALVAHVPGGRRFIVEAGLGEGPLDPLPLAEGTFSSGSFEYTIERDDRGWWVAQHPSVSLPGFSFSDSVATLSDFEPHHRRLSCSPESSFVKTLVVQRPFDDHIRTLRARTLFHDGPTICKRRVLEDVSAFAQAIEVNFGIDPEAFGAERLGRLWRQAVEQHARRDT
jgi:N-hydroxyarylamine O-acetyltransferase